jgi:hypothetical protein
MGETTNNTNLASEYYILSMLYRVGAEAYLTLGNKKSVDIIVKKKSKTITIDVKGLKGTTSFPIDNFEKGEKNHYFIFISFLDDIDNPEVLPEVYAVPSIDILKKNKALNGKKLIYYNPKGTRQVVQLSILRKLKNKYLNNWKIFI